MFHFVHCFFFRFSSSRISSFSRHRYFHYFNCFFFCTTGAPIFLVYFYRSFFFLQSLSKITITWLAIFCPTDIILGVTSMGNNNKTRFSKQSTIQSKVTLLQLKNWSDDEDFLIALSSLVRPVVHIIEFDTNEVYLVYVLCGFSIKSFFFTIAKLAVFFYLMYMHQICQAHMAHNICRLIFLNWTGK